MSGRKEILSLEFVVNQSNLIVVAEPNSTLKKETTADGLYSYWVQDFKVKNVLYPKEFTSDQITVSGFDSYKYVIEKKYAEGIRKIGIYRSYESVSQNLIKKDNEGNLVGSRILFLSNSDEDKKDIFVYTVQGSFESVNQIKTVTELVKKNKHPTKPSP